MKYPGSTHNHSEYSNERLRDSINKLEDIITYAAELGHSVFALTDHDTISGWVKAEKVYKKLKKEYPDFKLLRGNEIYLCREGLNAETWVSGDSYYHFILLAKDLVGAKQIMEISTRAWHRSYMQRGMRRVPTYLSDLKDIMGKNPGHIIGSTACLGGYLAAQLMKYQTSQDAGIYQDILVWLSTMQELFGKDNFYLELQPSATPEQEYVNQELIKISKEYDTPYIITCDAHYKSKEKRNIHKVYLNSQDGDREVDSFYATTYLMDTEELESYLPYMSREELDTAYQSIERIRDICEDFSLLKPLKIPELIWKVPQYNAPDSKQYWADLIPELKVFLESEYHGDNALAEFLINRLAQDDTWHNQAIYNEVNECLRMTRVSSEKNNVHWSAYYLNLQEIIDTCWEAGSIVGPGRGCFVPGSKITLSNGQTKNIEDIEIGDKVFTHLGRVREVKDTKRYTANEQMYRLQIQGTESIVCTNNHRFWAISNIRCKCKDNCVFSCKRPCATKNQLTPRWVEAQELREKDMVAIPRYRYQEKPFTNIDLAEYQDVISYSTSDDTSLYTYVGNIKNIYQRYIPLDKDFLYFLGVFIGDGWVRNRSEIGIAFNSVTEKDQASQRRIEQYLSSLNLSYKIIAEANGKKVNQLIFHNPFLGLLLKRWCGDGAEDKHIPDWCLYNDRDEMEALLYGLLNSDGCISANDKQIAYDTINYNLANQVRNLLSYLGVYASIKIRSPQGNCKRSYKVSSSGAQLALLSFLDFSGSRNITQRDNNYFYPRIEKITTEHYQGYVYDLSIEEDTSYIVNNIAVHNSGVGFILLYLLNITQINPLRETTKTFNWRFLNPDRVSVLDIDFDLSGLKRPQVLRAFREKYGEDRVANVATFGTEKSKSAILTAARGLGISVDDAEYMAGFIPADRGELRTLRQCYYGDEENGFKPIKAFIQLMDANPDLWEVAQEIEGLVCKVGIHAGGVIFVDEPFYESTALMRAPDGTIITQFDLHDAEEVS